jgi:serine/threonine-protein kinase
MDGLETVIVPRPNLSAPAQRAPDSSSDDLRAEARRKVALVEGSTPHLSAETRDLLRNRLRVAAIMFFVGFLAFLIRWLFYWSEWSKPEHMPLFYTHALVTIVLGAFAVRLCRHCSYSLKKLRVAELVIFGCPAIFFFVHGLQETMYHARLPEGQARLSIIVTPWVLLVFTYAMFIPNTWQRAAVVLGTIGAIPIGMLAYYQTIPAIANLASREEYTGAGRIRIANHGYNTHADITDLLRVLETVARTV